MDSKLLLLPKPQSSKTVLSKMVVQDSKTVHDRKFAADSKFSICTIFSTVGSFGFSVGPARLQKCVGDFCWRILPGIFREVFFGALFPTKMRRKNPAIKSAKKIRRLKKKEAAKIVLQKNRPRLVAFHRQTQNRSVLATQFPKSHPCPRGGGSKSQL